MMRRTTVLIIAIGIVAVTGFWLSLYDVRAGLQNVRAFFSKEPKSDGQPISYWMEHWYKNPTPYGDQPDSIGAKAAIRSMGTSAVPYLVRWISGPVRDASQGDYRQRALEAFQILGPVAKPAIPDLIKLVGEDRGFAARALTCIGKEAVPTLAQKLLETMAHTDASIINRKDLPSHTKSQRTQASIIQCFCRMGTNAEAAIPALVEALNVNERWLQWENPPVALASVGRNHPEIVIPALVSALTNSTYPAFNRGAIGRAMASFGTNHSDVLVPALIVAMGDDRTDDLDRREIAGALAVVGREHPDLVVPVLTAAFAKTKTEYRDRIAAALGAFGDSARSALPELLAASQSQCSTLRFQSAVAITRIAPETPGALAPLIQELESTQNGFRRQAIYELEKLGTNATEAVPALIECLSHRDVRSRVDATRCLVQLGVNSDEFINHLGENLSHPDYSVSGGAVSVLVRLARGSRTASVTLVKKALGSPVQRGVREQAKSHLIEVALHEPTFLLQCLDDSDSRVRTGALRVFYGLGHRVPESVPALQRLCENEPDNYLRSLAKDILEFQQQ